MDRNLKPVFDIAMAYDPAGFAIKSFKDILTVHMWINAECDIEHDIVPAMKATLKRNPHVRSFSYMTNTVEEFRDRRKARELAQEDAPEEVKQASEATKAKHIAFLTRRLGKRLPQEERWLTQYEAQHGEVTL